LALSLSARCSLLGISEYTSILCRQQPKLNNICVIQLQQRMMYECPCGEAIREHIRIVPIAQIIQEYVHVLYRHKYARSFQNSHLFIGYVYFKGKQNEFKSKSSSYHNDFLNALQKYRDASFASLTLCWDWVRGASGYKITAHWGNSSTNHRYDLDVSWDGASGIAKYANISCLTAAGRRGILPKSIRRRHNKQKIPILLHKTAESLNSMVYELRTANGLWTDIHELNSESRFIVGLLG
jgi:hypothetical protein